MARKQKTKSEALPPISTFFDPTLGLIEGGFLQPPSEIGSLAQIDGYIIRELVGEGGMGIVLLGQLESSDEKVALKLLRPGLAKHPSILARFLREAKHLSKLEHPHIVPLRELVSGEGGLALVMPYYPLGSLAKRLLDQGPPDREEILLILKQVALALKYAHAQGVTHNDLKPGNILFERSNHVRLGDFGLAREIGSWGVDGQESSVGDGTAPYMSPAVAQGQTDHIQGDTYSLGAVLYEMLSGQPPYSGESVEVIREKIAAGPPRPILELNPRADPCLVYVAEKAMGRENEERYSNIAALIRDLDPNRARRAIRAKDPKRKARIVAMIAVFLLVIASILGGLSLQTRLLHVETIQSQHVTRWRPTRPLEWDGLPGSELVTIEGHSLFVFDGDGELLNRIPSDQADHLWARMVVPLDLDGDGRDEVSFMTGNERETLVTLYDQHPYPRARFSLVPSPRHDKNGTFTSVLFPRFILAPEQSPSGRRTLATIAGTYYSDPSKSPWQRSLAVYDIETEALLWDVKVGPSLSSLEAVDLDGDEYVDFVLGTSSVRNGNKGVDDSSDFATYVYGIDDEGQILWRRTLGGEFDSAKVLGVAGASSETLVISVIVLRGEFGNEADNGYKSKIVQLNASGEILGEYAFETPIQDGLAVDLDSDGTLEVLALDRRGDLYQLEKGVLHGPRRLTEITGEWNTQLDRVLSTFLDFGRFHRQHGPLLAIAVCESFHYGRLNEGDASQPPTIKEYRNRRILFLDPRLEVVFDEPLPGSNSALSSSNCMAVDRDGDGILELMWMTDSLQFFSLGTYWEQLVGD